MNHRSRRVAAVSAAIALTALTAPPASAAPMSDDQVLAAIVTVSTEVGATVHVEDDAVPGGTKVVRVSTTCLGVAVTPTRVLTAALCLDVDGLSVRTKLRDAAIEDIPGLTTTEIIKLQEKATAEQWRIDGTGPGGALRAEYRVNHPVAGGPHLSATARPLSHDGQRGVAVLESAEPVWWHSR